MTARLFTPHGLWSATTWADRALCVALIGLSFLLPALARPTSEGPPEAIVTVGRTEVLRLPLDHDTTSTVQGRLGAVRLEVREGAIRVAEAGCPQRLCVAAGAKRRAGELIACVPNALLVRVRGGDVASGMPDAVTR